MIKQADFEYIRMLIRRRSAMVIEPGKEYLVEARLQPVAEREGLSSVADLVAALRSSPDGDLATRTIEAMAINETLFFRDLHPFEALRDIIVPELLAQRHVDETLVIWCGAASTGQEPYSVAMALREAGHYAAGRSIRIIASDISEAVLERARTGTYSQHEVNRGLPARLLVKYFCRHDLQWQINDDVRRMVDFQCINLMNRWPPLPMLDIVILRNVLIYFDQPTRRDILRRVRAVLSPRGYLFVGAAESVTMIDQKFRAVRVGSTICYQLRKD